MEGKQRAQGKRQRKKRERKQEREGGMKGGQQERLEEDGIGGREM